MATFKVKIVRVVIHHPLTGDQCLWTNRNRGNGPHKMLNTVQNEQNTLLRLNMWDFHLKLQTQLSCRTGMFGMGENG